jgi:hypothetical protein
MTDETMSYSDTLAYTQGLRRRIIDERISEGIPSDDDGVTLLLKAMKDMDQTAIQDRRNNIEEDNTNNAREVATTMKEFLSLQRNEDPFKRTSTGELPSHAIPQIDPKRLGDFTLVEGEKEIGILQEGADVFIERMKDKGGEN